MSLVIHPTQAYCGFVDGDKPCYSAVDAPLAEWLVKNDHRKRLCDRHAEEARKAGLKLEPISVLWR
jgi:hypothetical protein